MGIFGVFLTSIRCLLLDRAKFPLSCVYLLEFVSQRPSDFLLVD